MKRRIWTSDDLAEIRRRFRIGFTYAEIAGYFGVSRSSIANTVRRYGLIPADEASASVHEKSKGRPKTTAHKRALARGQRAVWTPARRASVSKKIKARRATDVGKAELQAGLRVVARNKRGFDLPDDLRAEYQFLRRSKHLTAREAGEVLGLIGRAG